MEKKSETDPEVYRVPTKQIFKHGLGILVTLVGIVGYFLNISAGYFINQLAVIGNNVDIVAEQVDTNILNISALSGRSVDCEGHQAELRVMIEEHIVKDETRMDKNEANIIRLQESKKEHRGLINECRRVRGDN